MNPATRKTKDVEREVTLRLVHFGTSAIRFVLEPWGEVYSFAPQDVFVVQARGPEPADPEVAYEEGAVTVSGWVGSTVRLFKNGEELGMGAFERAPVPDAFPTIPQETR
jgi:hypothetical protein